MGPWGRVRRKAEIDVDVHAAEEDDGKSAPGRLQHKYMHKNEEESAIEVHCLPPPQFSLVSRLENDADMLCQFTMNATRTVLSHEEDDQTGEEETAAEDQERGRLPRLKALRVSGKEPAQNPFDTNTLKHL
mmetsp:Transcript_40837/g.88370  ORF Transcript_40837/g.88370 Transcript_40837/m.88370 type:complete len:131 (-) Transcript_40837:229-621(-)